MIPDSTALLSQIGRDLIPYFGHAPSAICEEHRHSWLALSGVSGPADFNICAVMRGATPAELERVVKIVATSRLNAILFIDEGATELPGTAAGLGLTAVGAAPVMWWEKGKAIPTADRFKVRRVTSADYKANSGLIAEAYSLDPAMVETAVPEETYASAVEGWVAERDGEIIGTGTFIRGTEGVGVYTMGTPAKLQRQGIGRTLLEAAMTEYMKQGIETFHLMATEAGFHLYEQLGFKTVASPHVFLIGESTQFPQH